MGLKITAAFVTAAVLATAGIRHAVWPAPQCLLRDVQERYKTTEFGQCLHAMHREVADKGEADKAGNIRRVAGFYGAPIDAPRP